MSTNTVTSFSSLWKPAGSKNIEAGKVSIGTIQAGWLGAQWSEDELALLHNLRMGSLPLLLPNRCTNGLHATAFNQKRFFNTRFSVKVDLSCATRHLPHDYGRATGTPKALADEFYSLVPYSDGGGRQLCRTGLPGCRGSRSGTSVQTAITAQRGGSRTIHA